MKKGTKFGIGLLIIALALIIALGICSHYYYFTNDEYCSHKLIGHYVEFEDNIEVHYSCLLGFADGEITSYYNNGQLKSKDNMKKGRNEGEWIEYYENGKLKGKGNYKDGKPDGEQIRYFENEQLESIDEFKDGYWKHILYYNNGQLAISGIYINGKRSGEWTEFYEDGQLKSRENNEGYISYYANGQILTKGTYKNGSKDGEWIEYYENGQIKFKETYKDGKLEGNEEYYEKNGNPLKDYKEYTKYIDFITENK